MSILQEKAINMIEKMPDDRVQIIISIMDGFMQPIDNNSSKDTSKRIGIAKGKFEIPDDIDICNAEIAKLFGVE